MNRSHDYDKILTRLTTILQRLYEGESLGVSELAEEFNVSTKTIQRDFNERLARFPIEKEGRRWRMKKGFRLEKVTDLQSDLTLQILESLAQSAGGDFYALSRRLLGRLRNQNEAPIQSRLAIEDITPSAELFAFFEEAILSHTRTRFLFHGKERRVDPYRILNFDGYWYLLGFEHHSGLAKKYYLKEIRNPRLLDVRFTPDSTLIERIDGALNIWFDPNKEPFALTLLAREPIVKYLRRRPLAPSQREIEHHPNGDVTLQVNATTVKEAIEAVKRWLPDLQIIAPEEARLSMVEMLRRALRRQTGHDAV